MGTLAPAALQLRDGAQLIVRSAARADVEALHALRRAQALTGESGYREPDEFVETPAGTLVDLTTAERRPRALYLVAVITGELAGCARRVGDERRRAAHRVDVELLVAPAHRRRGVALSVRATENGPQESPCATHVGATRPRSSGLT
jgi:hypothetical protein